MHVGIFLELTEWLKIFKLERALSIIIMSVQWRSHLEATRCQVYCSYCENNYTFINAITMAMDTGLFTINFSNSHFLTVYTQVLLKLFVMFLCKLHPWGITVFSPSLQVLAERMEWWPLSITLSWKLLWWKWEMSVTTFKWCLLCCLPEMWPCCLSTIKLWYLVNMIP